MNVTEGGDGAVILPQGQLWLHTDLTTTNYGVAEQSPSLVCKVLYYILHLLLELKP